MDRIYDYFTDAFAAAVAAGSGRGRRIGVEMKFPLVSRDGNAVSEAKVRLLWDYLRLRGWRPIRDEMTSRTIGACKTGQYNDTVAGCETGYCKTEFSLAHTGDLFRMAEQIADLRAELEIFGRRYGVEFIGYGIHPVTPPGRKLLLKKGRTSPWSRVFPSNRRIPKDKGDDVHLFTVNAGCHVHVSVSMEEAVDAVNVLNGFAGPQIALTANSSVWQGRIESDYKCVSEKLWDWWMPDEDRVGIPARPFRDLRHYVHTVAGLRPVFITRHGKPIVLQKYRTFREYYSTGRAVGVNAEGREVSFIPEKSDIDLHNSCYWYNARVSRYYTVENRANDQQPPDAMMSVPALTLGLVSALGEAKEELSSYDWPVLRQMRQTAIRSGPAACGGGQLRGLAGRMLAIARLGLSRRRRGEEEFLEPLCGRLSRAECPADEAVRLFSSGGAVGLVNNRKI